MQGDTPKAVVYDRNKLYEEVWKEPVVIVAKRYGVSDEALHKICKRLQVPMPGRGYWAKHRAGARMRKPALKKAKGPQCIYVNRPERQDESLRSDKDNKEEIMGTIKEARDAILLENDFLKLHTLVSQTKQEMSIKRRKDNSSINEKQRKLNISVDSSSLERALSIFDVLFKILEKMNYRVGIDEKSATYVEINEEKLYLELKEKIRSVPHVLTAEELEKQRKGKYFYAPPYDYTLTAMFTLRLNFIETVIGMMNGIGKTERLNELKTVL